MVFVSKLLQLCKKAVFKRKSPLFFCFHCFHLLFGQIAPKIAENFFVMNSLILLTIGENKRIIVVCHRNRNYIGSDRLHFVVQRFVFAARINCIRSENPSQKGSVAVVL